MEWIKIKVGCTLPDKSDIVLLYMPKQSRLNYDIAKLHEFDGIISWESQITGLKITFDYPECFTIIKPPLIQAYALNNGVNDEVD